MCSTTPNCSRTVIYTSTIPGTIVCGLVLLAYATVLLYPNARKLLDRVSLRLLVYALISKWVIFSVRRSFAYDCYSVVFGIVSSVSMPGGVGPGCRAGEFLYDVGGWIQRPAVSLLKYDPIVFPESHYMFHHMYRNKPTVFRSISLHFTIPHDSWKARFGPRC